MAILSCALLVVIFSKYIVYPIAIAILAIVGVFEILRVIGVHKKYALAIPAYMIAALFPIAAYFVEQGSIVSYLLGLAASIFIYLIWLMGVSVFSRGKVAFSKVSEAFAAVTYVTVSCCSLSLLRYLNNDYGVFFVVLVFVVAWICDVFAYLVGSLIGKHKLIPEVSPKKTVEGAIGGVVFSALLSLVYGVGLDFIVKSIDVNYFRLFLFGAVLSVVSQLGDLIASLIKREYGVKDYSNIFPGHGGVMDRFDSVLAVSTILLILSIVFPPFVAG